MTDSRTQSNSFPKSSRLLNSQDFQQVFDDAAYKISHANLLLLARPNTLGKPRLGLVIAKKNVPKAHQRNRVKRLVRETFRCEHHLPAIDAIVLARRGLDQLSREDLNNLLRQQWQRLIRKCDSTPQRP